LCAVMYLGKGLLAMKRRLLFIDKSTFEVLKSFRVRLEELERQDYRRRIEERREATRQQPLLGLPIHKSTITVTIQVRKVLRTRGLPAKTLSRAASGECPCLRADERWLRMRQKASAPSGVLKHH
jgi:hypothetical protein